MSYFSEEKIAQYAPGADCIPAMKIWKLPDGKESMFPEICESGEYFATLKKDGYWYMFEKTNDGRCYLFSRTVSRKTGILSEKIANVPHIEKALDCLPCGSILIGEIYYPNGTSKDVTTIMGCLSPEAIKRQESRGLIHYYIHDVIKYNGVDLKNEGSWVRYQVLKELWNKFYFSRYDYLELAQAITEDIQEATAKALSDGEEGMVLKKKNFPYQPDKRPAWSSIKIKKMDDADVFVIGVCDATKEYTGKEIETWEYWETPEGLKEGQYYLSSCEYPSYYNPVTKGYYYGWKTAIRIGVYDENGKIIEIGTVSSGLNDELKNDLKDFDKYYLRVCAVGCMEKDNKERTLRHPFFKNFRDDKDAKDCVVDAIFN